MLCQSVLYRLVSVALISTAKLLDANKQAQQARPDRLPLFGAIFASIADLVKAGAISLLLVVPTVAGEKGQDPLQLTDVTALALQNRAEILVVSARASALAQRAEIVSSLDDPTISFAIDHYPYDPMEEGGRRFSRSLSIEQRFPLSRIRNHRRSAAEADAERGKFAVEVTKLDVVAQAQQAFFMLLERRKMQKVIESQISLAQQMVDATVSRYTSGTGSQTDVLRAEVEVSRLRADRDALIARTKASEAMLNAALGQSTDSPIPQLLDVQRRTMSLSEVDAIDYALSNRPELDEGNSEVDRLSSEVEVMRSMYRPMAMLRIGQASTMQEGAGGMLMVGVSLPIWRSRLQAGVEEAKAMRQMARADIDAMRRMIVGETVAARQEVNAVLTKLQAVEKDVLPRAAWALNSALASYTSGSGTLVAVVEAARALWDVQAEQVMIESATGVAWAGLDRSLGVIQGEPR